MDQPSVKPAGYIPRIVDEQVERYLRIFGAVEIEGTKWCGKTWTARRHGASISYVDEQLALAQDDPSLMLLGEQPHIIDEWQRVPAIWNLVRHGVDETRALRGAWILTGSSAPPSRQDATGEADKRHSGAGRIGRIKMSPMTLSESGDSEKTVSFARLFEEPPSPAVVGNDTQRLIEVACRGGWPEALDLTALDAQTIAREYLAAVCYENAPDHGLDPFVTERVIASLARNLGQAATYGTIREDALGSTGSDLTDRQVGGYLSFLRRIYLLAEVPGWEPPSRSKKRLQTKPKRYLADPSLAVAALGLSPQGLVQEWQTFGLIFENLCLRDLTVYARAHELARPVPVRYYRDDSGLEVDAVVELADGRWAAFEIKTSENKVDSAVANLKRLRKKLCENPRAQMRPPSFMAVITGIGTYARVIEDGIYVIPIRALTA